MLSEAIGDLTTPAMAVALSPFPIVAIALVLGGPGGLRVGAAFCAASPSDETRIPVRTRAAERRHLFAVCLEIIFFPFCS